MRKVTKRVAAVAAAAVIGIGAMGTAWAYFTASGSGTGSASAASQQALSITGTVGTALYPGASGALGVSISNPNAYPVSITGIAVGAGGITSSVAGCEEFVTLNTSVVSGGSPIAVAGGGTTASPAVTTGSLAGAVSMSSGAEDGCAGATFTIPLTISGSQTV